MKLNFEQIKSITQGAEIIKKNDGINFFRFTKDEQRIYSTTEFYPKTFSTAGIRMDFITDGNELNLKIETKTATTRTYFSMDVFVNEKHIGSITNFDDSVSKEDYTVKNYQLGKYFKKFTLGEGKKNVSIIFPWSVATTLEEMEIENATYIVPFEKRKKLVLYGDSITNGYDALYSFNTYAVQLGNILDAEIYNKAIGGEVFFPELVGMSSITEPDYVVVAYGSNDWGKKEREDFNIRCSKFFKEISYRYSKSTIFVITPIWRADYREYRKFGQFEEVEKYIKEVCSLYKNIRVISGFDFVPHDTNLFADLRLHPSDKGFEHYITNLSREIEKEVKNA